MKTTASMDATLKDLGTLFDKEIAGSSKADLSNLRRLLETSEHVPLDVYFKQLKADVRGKEPTQVDNGKGQARLDRIMAR
ncbi:MAG: hypothetical protein L3J67_05575 [Hyphomicrobiaceae bacterium]|nr:hypothetical protein [Hyphomicrobiaceae bacterium]